MNEKKNEELYKLKLYLIGFLKKLVQPLVGEKQNHQTF
jgi:hypothetical protein